jgi:uncharacterized protein YPO0396
MQMPWPDWLPWSRGQFAEEEIDIERVATEGMRDIPSARQAIDTLKRERKNLVRREKSVNKSFKRSRWNLYRISMSSKESPDFGAHQLSQAMRDTHAAEQAGALRKEQIAALEGKIQEIDRALVRLEDFTRQWR